MEIKPAFQWGAAAAFCALLTVAMLPPSEALPSSSRQNLAPETLERWQIGNDLQAARAQLQLLDFRDSAAALLRHGDREFTPGRFVIADSRMPGVVVDQAELYVSEMQPVGPGPFVMPHVLVLLSDTAPMRRRNAEVAAASAGYLLPESALFESDMCVTVMLLSADERQADFFTLETPRWRGDDPRLVAATPGPCRFYSEFGRPGARIAAWLDRTNFAASMSARSIEAVDMMREYGALGNNIFSALVGYTNLVTVPVEGRRCWVNQRDACTEALLHKERSPAGYYVVSAPPQNDGRDRVMIDRRFLASLLHDEGADAFRNFWTSPLEPDAAFLAAYGITMHDWTHRWLTSQIGRSAHGAVLKRGHFLSATALVVVSLLGAMLIRFRA